MGAIRFQCDVCQAAIVVDASEVGSTTSCPNCRRTLTVPALSPTSSTQSTGELPPASQGLPAMTPQAALDLPPIEGFEIIQKLGAGGMGAVYKARQTSLNRFVALKVMSHALARDPEFIDRFKREAATAAQFKHPNIVQVHAAGECSGIHYMAMEFVEGRSLRDHIRSHGRLEPQEAIAITLHVAEGLKYAWNKSRMIHRDIKPDNIFLSTAGEVLVGDMGLAKNLGGSSTEMTSTGMMLGSPHYISPEQAMATKDIDFRADIYSLGCTLYHMLTGRTAYEGDSSMALMLKHVHDPPPDIFEALPECPRKLGVMVTRMMAKNRDDRPPNYEELIAGLWEASESLSGETEIGRPPAAQSLAPTAVGHVAAVPTVAAVPPKPVSPAMIYGVVGGVIALMLVGLFLWSPWKSRISPVPYSEWKNLIPSIDPKRDGKVGRWTVENGKLLCTTPSEWARCEVPVDYRGGNYDLRFRFTRGEGFENCFFFLFRKGNTGGVLVFDYFNPNNPNSVEGVKAAGLWRVEGKHISGRKKHRSERPSWLPKGQEKTVLLQVRDEGMVASLDGEEMFRWKGNWADVDQLDKMFSDSNSTRPVFGVSCHMCEAVFSTIEMREVSDKSTFTHGGSSGTSNTPSPQHSSALTVLGNVFTNSVGAEMVYIPPGEFTMGSTKEEQAWAVANGMKEEDEKQDGVAPRKTRIKNEFWLGQTEVTVGQWKRFVTATGYKTDAEKEGEASYAYDRQKKTWERNVKGASWRAPGFDQQDSHPVCCVSWNDAVAFCEWLTERERKTGRLASDQVVRLPTEAEWEYACRAGTQTKFWWGETKEDGKDRLNWWGTADGYEFTSPVDSFGSRGRNGFGLADMLGNVYEWCLDDYDSKQAHEECYKGNPSARVVRGGSFNHRSPAYACCAHRGSLNPSCSYGTYGIRVAIGLACRLTATASASPAAAPKESGILAPPETRVATLTTTPKVGEVYTLPLGSNVTMELMGIPPGEFTMGSTKEEQAWAVANRAKEDFVKREGETPRKATIKRGFWLGRTEVTVRQWKEFVVATGYKTDAEKNGYVSYALQKGQSSGRMDGLSWRNPGPGAVPKDNDAVCCVSWNDAKAFCEWLDRAEQRAGRLAQGYAVRLPTEAEWEYACRAGTQTKFWWGEDKEDGKGRLNWRGEEDGFIFVSPVDHYGAQGRNGFGLADMLGNLQEWCLDEYDATQSHAECYIGNPRMRVSRGGSFNHFPALNRCATRFCTDPVGSSNTLGFRICYGVDMSGTTTTTAPTASAVAPKEGGILAPPETRAAALTTNPKVGEVYTLPLGSNVTMELMGIPPGEFMLGSTKEEQAWANANEAAPKYTAYEGEAPRKATIQQGFWLGRTEVTVGQWKQFVSTTGYQSDAEKRGFSNKSPKGGKQNWGPVDGASWKDPKLGIKLEDNHAVSCINWNDAVAFCEWLNEREQKSGQLPPGFKVRLPGEAEWEYACRARTQTKFWWGDTTENGKDRLNWFRIEGGFAFTSPVDSFGARGRNGFGLADMLGNVSEWCLDEFDETEAHEEPFKGNPRVRVLRGGSFHSSRGHDRCASRFTSPPTALHSDFGFRICVGVAR